MSSDGIERGRRPRRREEETRRRTEKRNRVKRDEISGREGVTEGEKKNRGTAKLDWGWEILGIAEGDVGKTNTRLCTQTDAQVAPCTRDQGRNLPAKGPRCEQREYIITMSSRLLGEPLSEVS